MALRFSLLIAVENKEFQRVNAIMTQQAWNTFANLIGNVNITKKISLRFGVKY